MELGSVDQRVLGSLLEKERTVPATYPLTLNALRSACNQTSGRDPILDLGEHELLASIDRLKGQGLARIVHAGSGARATKYRQVIDEQLALDGGQRAILTLLLLRGPQTPGELRSRSDRLYEFRSLEAVDAALLALATRDEPLVVELERRPGQKERRWAHLLGDQDPTDPTGPVLAAAAGEDLQQLPQERVVEGLVTADEPSEAVLEGGVEARDRMVVDAYDAVAASYADELLDELDGKPFDRWLLERLAAEVGDEPAADVGTGPGHVAAHLAAAGAGSVVGFDLSPGMVAEAQARWPELAFEVADLRSLPTAPDGDGWALVTAWYALVHLAGSELPAAVAALAGALRPGGTLAVAVHVGREVRRLEQWMGHDVDVVFTFHDPARVLAAVAHAGLVDVEWYQRGPYPGREADTQRLYVVARRPT